MQKTAECTDMGRYLQEPSFPHEVASAPRGSPIGLLPVQVGRGQTCKNSRAQWFGLFTLFYLLLFSLASLSLTIVTKTITRISKNFRELFFEQRCNDKTFNYTQIMIRELFVVVACNEPTPSKICLDAETMWDQAVAFRTTFGLDLLLFRVIWDCEGPWGSKPVF